MRGLQLTAKSYFQGSQYPVSIMIEPFLAN